MYCLFYLHDLCWYTLLKRNNIQKFIINSDFFLCFVDTNFHKLRLGNKKLKFLLFRLIYLNILAIQNKTDSFLKYEMFVNK